MSDAAQNLIEGVQLEDFEADLRQGDGIELSGKFRAAYSSSALAVNTFAPFKRNLPALGLPGGDDFACLYFERKCPHGIPGRRAPNLDALAESSSGVVAVESKCLEHLTSHVARFAPAYETGIEDRRWPAAWVQEMRRLIKDPRTYRWLDAAQLVKHAFGLAFTFQDRPATLLYLFWEPSNTEAYPVFAEHRAEIVRFSELIGEGGPDFVAMSYPELWRLWDERRESVWIPAHVARLRARYGVTA